MSDKPKDNHYCTRICLRYQTKLKYYSLISILVQKSFDTVNDIRKNIPKKRNVNIRV